ncbi:MAG: amidohydrolase family protein [Mycobacterium sp.]
MRHSRRHFSTRYLNWALEVLGAERVIFAADYPFASAAGGVARHFLDVLDDDDRDKIASGNWDRMCAGIRR